MIEANLLMQQAGMTANTWMIEAKRFVEDWFEDYPPSARATLIAAYVNAAAGDEIAMYLRNLTEAVGDINLTLDTRDGL